MTKGQCHSFCLQVGKYHLGTARNVDGVPCDRETINPIRIFTRHQPIAVTLNLQHPRWNGPAHRNRNIQHLLLVVASPLQTAFNSDDAVALALKVSKAGISLTGKNHLIIRERNGPIRDAIQIYRPFFYRIFSCIVHRKVIGRSIPQTAFSQDDFLTGLFQTIVGQRPFEKGKVHIRQTGPVIQGIGSDKITGRIGGRTPLLIAAPLRRASILRRATSI